MPDKRIDDPIDFGKFDPNFRNPAIEKQMTEIGRAIKRALPPTHGFLLLIAKFGEDEEEAFYTSSIERESAIKTLREFLRRLES